MTDYNYIEEELEKIPIFTTGMRQPLNKNGKRPYTMVYGLTSHTNKAYRREPQVFKNGDLSWSKLKVVHPEFFPFLYDLGEELLPKDFIWTSVMINLNFEILPHKDSKNMGISYMITFGNYTNGRTVVKYSDNEQIAYNTKYNMTTFNGSKYLHWVEPFEGRRWTLVFYNHVNESKEIIQKTLEENGVYYPWFD